MSPSVVALPKVKRIDSKVRKDNRNAAKRAKRATKKKEEERERNRLAWEAKVKEYDDDPKYIKRKRLEEEAIRQKALEAAEAKETLTFERKKRRLFTQQQRRNADATILQKSNAKRLKGSEKKAVEEQKRKDAEAEENLLKQRAKFKRCRDKAKMGLEEKCVFTLAHTTTMKCIYLVEDSMEAIITISKCHLVAMDLLRYGLIDALFTCLRRFTTEQTSLLSLQVLTSVLTAVHNNRRLGSDECLNLRRSTFLKLSTLKACDYIAQVLDSMLDDVEIVHECVEVWHCFLRPITSYYYHYPSPCITDMCSNSRIEKLVVAVFNEHEQHSTTDVFAQHCLGLMLVYVSNDVSARHRPRMCKVVIMAWQKYAENGAVQTICKQVISELSKNMKNKEMLNVIDT